MTSDDVRTVAGYGKRIAACILKMGDVLTIALRCCPPDVGAALLERLADINAEMDRATDAFCGEATISELDA